METTEFEKYDIADLELIVDEQRDLYSEEELDMAREVLSRKKHEESSHRSNTANVSLSDVNLMFTLLCICTLLSPLCGLVSCIGVGVKGTYRIKPYMKTLIAATIVSFVLRTYLAYGGILHFI